MGAVNPGWWRRNTLALVAAAVLVPAAAVVIGGNEWWDSYSSRPVFPQTVDPGSEAVFADADWGPATAAFVTPDPGADVPRNARVIEARVPLTPVNDPVACSTPVLRELQGQQRQWDEAAYEFSAEYDADTSTLCPSDRTDPYTVVVRFLVPADAVGPFGFDFSPSDQLPRFLRFVVTP